MSGEPLVNTKHELFAQAYAKTGNAAESYISAGYSKSGASASASRLLTNVKVSSRVAELKQIISDGVVRLEIGERSARIAELQDRWNRMRAVIKARSEDPSVMEAAGGDTGLLVRNVKSVGNGPRAEIVEEFAVDTGLLKEMRELEKQAAIEAGQWAEGKPDVPVGESPEDIEWRLAEEPDA